MSLDWVEQLHFIRPWWFLAVIGVVLASFYFWRHGRKSNAWTQVIDDHLLKHLLISQKLTNAVRVNPFWFILASLLAIIAMAGPTFEKRPLPVFESEISKVILLDLSLSMDTTDIKPSRLIRAKYKINDILSTTNEGQIALIVYAGDAFVISPLTTDAKTIATLVPPLSPGLMPVLGSEPARAFELADELLLNAGVFSGQIIWLTDSLDDDDYPEIKEFLSKSPHQVSILAVGTVDGAPIPLADGQGFLKDSQGNIVVPGLNYSVLEELATTTSASISPLTAGDEDIKYLMSQLKKPQEFIASEDDLQMDTWIEFGPWLLLPVLLIVSLLFRRGLVFGLIILVSPIVTNETSAAEQPRLDNVSQENKSLKEQLEWLWLTPDQQGQKAFKQDKHLQAAELFENPAWKSAAQYRSGQFQAAMDTASDQKDATGYYNRGNALAKSGALEEAIQSYEKTLEMESGHEDAAFNKKLVEDLLKQQQEQQQQDQEQDQENQDQQQQDQQQQDQQQQDQDQQ